MRIALDSIVFGLQRLGGITTYWAALARGLAARQDVTPVLLQPRHVTTLGTRNLATSQLPAVRERLPAFLSRYMTAQTILDCELQHSSYYRLPRERRVRSIVTVYDFIYEARGRGLARHVHGAQKRRAVERADAIICISNRTRDELRRRWPWVHGEKVSVVPLAVDHDRWYPAATLPGVHESGDRVLFVGRRDGYKRFDLAVAAVERVPELRLTVVGSVLTPREEAHLRSRLGNRAQTLGEVDERSLRLLYSTAHALVVPSEDEGFGLPVLEAMACGCPVVAGSRSGLDETGGTAARWVHAQDADAYADALRSLGHTEARAAAVRSGLAQAARFTWADTIDRTVAVYRSLV
jgi:mannosyltransferase